MCSGGKDHCQEHSQAVTPLALLALPSHMVTVLGVKRAEASRVRYAVDFPYQTIVHIGLASMLRASLYLLRFPEWTHWAFASWVLPKFAVLPNPLALRGTAVELPEQTQDSLPLLDIW